MTKNNNPTDIGPGTRHLLSYTDLQKKLYLSRTQTFRLEREGARLAPDVMIASGKKGWDPDRVLRYGVDTGRLHPDGSPAGGWDATGRAINRAPEGSIPEMRRIVEEKYSTPPEVYISPVQCSLLYGLGEINVFFLRRRGTFIPAAVKIGRDLGWDEKEVIQFGYQTGRLEDPETLRNWAHRRTEEFGMDPRTPWVVELLGEDNLPTIPSD